MDMELNDEPTQNFIELIIFSIIPQEILHDELQQQDLAVTRQ